MVHVTVSSNSTARPCTAFIPGKGQVHSNLHSLKLKHGQKEGGGKSVERPVIVGGRGTFSILLFVLFLQLQWEILDA
jgi:hypothetical protein